MCDACLGEAAPRPLQCDQVLGPYKGKSVVVTGARGFLGSVVVGLLGNADCRIVRVLRDGGVSSPRPVRAQVEDVIGNIGESGLWERVLAEADIVFHFAAQTSAAQASENPAGDFEANVRPLLCLLETCQRTRLRRTVVFSGTATQVGIPARMRSMRGTQTHR